MPSAECGAGAECKVQSAVLVPSAGWFRYATFVHLPTDALRAEQHAAFLTSTA